MVEAPVSAVVKSGFARGLGGARRLEIRGASVHQGSNEGSYMNISNEGGSMIYQVEGDDNDG